MDGAGADSRTQAAIALPAWLRTTPTGVILALRVQPGARRSSVVGLHAGRLKIALQAPPVEGRANEALVAFIAGILGVAKRQVSLIAGERNRDKLVELRSVDPAAVARALSPEALES
jgi:uncharacterized protein (TIGR00251 family)